MTGLEALEKLDETLCDIEIKHKENLGYTKPLTRTIEKELKALEIIKEKDVDIYILTKCKTVDEYNSKIVHIVGETRELTEEELDTIKEVLE